MKEIINIALEMSGLLIWFFGVSMWVDIVEVPENAYLMYMLVGIMFCVLGAKDNNKIKTKLKGDKNGRD